MFGRGSWAIFGLGKESLETFRTILEDRAIMVAASQMAASAVTRYSSADTIGVNPFSGPRLDEEHPVGSEHEPELAGYATSEQEERSSLTLPAEILDCAGYGVTEAQFRLHPTMPWYGLWAVSNEWKDVSDVASSERPCLRTLVISTCAIHAGAIGSTATWRASFSHAR